MDMDANTPSVYAIMQYHQLCELLSSPVKPEPIEEPRQRPVVKGKGVTMGGAALAGAIIVGL
jgi:hypothetical protein